MEPRKCPYSVRATHLHQDFTQKPQVTTKNYIKELYWFAYTLINFAEQDNIRATLWDYIEGNVTVDFFHDDICRALAVDTKAQYVLGA